MKIDREKLIYDLSMCNATAAAVSNNINQKSFSPIDVAKFFVVTYQAYCQTEKGKQTIDTVIAKIKDSNI